MQNSKCYEFKRYDYTDGLLNNSVDATYIVHLEGNGRLPDIEKQLLEYHPTNIVYIVFNKGYKKCKKDLKVQSSIYDITHANIEIMKHSRSNGYFNTLILEDDFIFDKSIKERRNIDNINDFVHSHKNDSYMYHLGAIPILSVPYNLYTFYTPWCFTTHATIFSKRAQDYIIEYDAHNEITDWDIFLIYHIRRYIYYFPLCYQTFPETENKSNWNQPEFASYLANGFISLNKFDVQPEPGTSIIYLFSLLFVVLFVVFIVFCIRTIMRFVPISKSVAKLFHLPRR